MDIVTFIIAGHISSSVKRISLFIALCFTSDEIQKVRIFQKYRFIKQILDRLAWFKIQALVCLD